MITLQDYSIKSELYRGDKSIVFRGEKENVPVIIKYLNIEYPNQSEIDYFQKEFNFLKKISLPCVIKPIAIEDYKNSSILVFEDIQGKSLREILKEKENFSLEEFLDLAILITSALGELHGQGVVHKDIKPHNIIYNYKTKKLQIIDFGNATFLSRENPSINPKNLEGTLSYISPEQTGRMNRSIDYRSDYYSLGVTFYQLITGVLPFVSKNSMELVFSHLAKLPTPPHLLSDSTKFIPEIISEIILKLLEKNPENRYQSTNGLLHDLTECKLKFEADGKIDSFILMTKDISKQFRIPEKLYGREKESESLIKIFEQTTFGHLKLALVSGHSGMGKTALIQEVQKPIGKSMGRFISGKFDKFKKNMPYYAIIQAFRNLVEQMLTLDRNEIQDIKDDIQIALGKNGKVLTDIVPELELIVGEQPSIINLSSLEAQNRLNLLFIKFIQVFCKSNNPLVLFLDDLQWADNSSLNLLKTILTDKSLEFLMVILSYRSNEVDNTHPFSILLDEVKKTDVEIENISINPLSEKDVNQLVSETLVSNTNSCEELSNIIHLKTGGNPFFVSSIFTSLYNESLIYFEDKWKWEISKIKQISISENVIDHTKDKISQLDLDKIDILKMAACIGNRFVISVFCKIINKSLTETEEILAQLSNDGYFILGGNEARFAHDKIREATYTFISEEEKSLNHYNIGIKFLELCNLGIYDLDDYIFTIVNQINQGLIHIRDEKEKEYFLNLNMKAIDKAISSSAYESALILTRVAIKLLPENSWEIMYGNSFELYKNLATAEYLNGNDKHAENCFDILLKNAKTNLERANVNEIRISYYTSKSKLKEALETGIETLNIIGFPLPELSQEAVVGLIGEANNRLGDKSIESLLELPLIDDQLKLAALRILSTSLAPAFIANPGYFPILVLKMVNISLEHGNSSIAGFGYTLYGFILGSILGNYEVGQKFGELGVTLIDKLNAKDMKCKTFFFFAGMINHWKKHIKENKTYFLASLESGIDSGDFQYSSYSINYLLFQPIHSRENLEKIKENSRSLYKKMISLNQEDSRKAFLLWEQLIINLTEFKDDVFSLKGEKFDEKEELKLWQEVQNVSCLFWYYQCKTMLYYIFGEFDLALENSELALSWEGGSIGLTSFSEQNFLHSLSCLSSKKLPIETVQKNQERMKVWAENCPANYGHKYYIVEAELARINGKTEDALEFYDKAIKLAKEHEYLLEEAIANELAAKYWLGESKEMFANEHLTEAHYAYKKWGCKPKVEMMEKEYPFLKP